MERHMPIATRHSLLSRLKDWDDQESWRQFFETYWRLIYSTARKAGLTEAEAQEVVQETVVAIAKNLKELQFDKTASSFKSWLLRITRWRITDQLRKRGRSWQSAMPAPTATDETAVIERIADPNCVHEQQWEADWRENMLEAAMARVREQVPAKHFQAFDLYVTRKWPVAKVARTVGMNAANIYLVKFRLLKLLKAEIKRLESELV